MAGKAMTERDPFENQTINRLKLFLYLLPIVGFVPALWSLYYRHGDRQQEDLCRVVVVLTLGWLIGYLGLGVGAEWSESAALPLLISSSVLTSGYFLTHLWLIIQFWQRKSIRLPGISQLGDRLP